MWVSDLDQVIVGARLMLQGDNPYTHIGPGRQWDSLWPLYYPGPALVLATPLAPLPIPAARAVFIATAMFAFTYALLRRAPHCWPMLLSYPVLATVDLTQWAPLLAAETWVPNTGFRRRRETEYRCGGDLPERPSVKSAMCLSHKPRKL